MNVREMKKSLSLWTAGLLILSNLFATVAHAAPVTINNQSASGYSGVMGASPIVGEVEMTGYGDWPDGFSTGTPGNGGNPRFNGSVFDGENIWLIPSMASQLVKVNKTTGTMEEYSQWPQGFTRSATYPDFAGAVFDGENIWLIPLYAEKVIKVNKDSGEMTAYSNWPSSFLLPSAAPPNPNPIFSRKSSNFAGGVFDGQRIWLIPSYANALIAVDKDTGTMTHYNQWPGDVKLPGSGVQIENGGFLINSNFSGGVFDGQSIWLIPVGVDRLVKVDKDTGEMESYNDWPSGFEKDYFSTTGFSGGVFDGESIWMAPSGINTVMDNTVDPIQFSFNLGAPVVKVNTATGVMTDYRNWPGGEAKSNFSGVAFDGQSIWLYPATTLDPNDAVSELVKVDIATGTMTGYSNWPVSTTMGSFPFAGGVFDGESLWLAPAGANEVVKIGGTKVDVSSVTLSPATLALIAGGETGAVTADVAPSNATNKKVTFTSSDPDVATVDEEGTVTPLKAGEAIITATTEDGGKTATSTITVKEAAVAVTGVTISPASLTLVAGGDKGTVTSEIAPGNATNKKVTFTSSDPDVATVDEEGTVTPLKAGEAIITATTEDGGKTATSTITVKEAAVAVTGVTISPASLTLVAGGDNSTVTSEIAPGNATNKKVTFTSSDPSVATVDEEGTVTPLKAGEAIITATTEDGGKTATVSVTVKESVPVTGVTVSPAALKLTAGGSKEKLTATVAPSNATNKKVTFTSSDPAVASVDEEGTVTPLKAGTATITATTEDGNKTVVIVVTVDGSEGPTPTNLAAAAGNGSVNLTWTVVDGTVSYSVYQRTASGGYGTEPVATVSGSSYTATGLVNGTEYYFIIKANGAEGAGNYSNEAKATPISGSQNSGGNPSTGNPSGPNSGTGAGTDGQGAGQLDFRIIVNGKQYDQIATGNTTKEEGKSVLTAAVDTAKLLAQLGKEGDKSTIVIPVSTVNVDKVSTVLTGEAVKAMEGNQATLEVLTSNGNYRLPAGEIAIDSLSAQLGVQVKLSDIVVRIDIAKSNDAKAQLAASTAEKGMFSVVVPPVDFTVTAEYNGKTVEVDKFSAYVQRDIPLPDDVDPNRITTATVLMEDGTVYHVPTYVTVRDGKYYAVVSSLTNSTYTLIWHPITFSDVDKHWSRNAVNDMGSRLIVKGVDETRYNPDDDISRAEFAAIIVRALGLAENGKTASFQDVKPGDWYMGAVAKAAEYGLVEGYEDGLFRPEKTITREEALVIVARAMKLTSLGTDVSDEEIASVLAEFADGLEVDGWAKQAVAAAIKNGVIQGRDNGLKPLSNITRAEAAVIAQRLLMQSELIDVRNSK
ncbi:Ig-like domain-containing protein [Paenibacillus sp. CAU 1782]